MAFTFTEEGIKNLHLLADYLSKLPENYDKFDMRNWAYDAANDVVPSPLDVAYNCGFVCCAIGHLSMVDGATRPEGGEWFGGYADRILFNNQSNYSSDHVLGEFMFGWRWVDVDNTPQGAVARINYVLNNLDTVQHTLTEMYTNPCNMVYHKWLTLYKGEQNV